MDVESYLNYCLSFPFTEESTPFGDEYLVMKVKGKVFAIFPIDPFVSINLKCDPDLAVELREKFSYVKPGYHMNKKHWNTIEVTSGVSEKFIKQWTEHSYLQVVNKLPGKDKKIILELYKK